MISDCPPVAAYAAGIAMEVEGPPKHPRQTERLLHSLRVRGDLSPLLFIGLSDGTLRSYVVDGRVGVLRWQADYKRLYHASCVVLDGWGVFITIIDNRLKLAELPLQNNPQLTERDDTKGAVLFAAHEDSRTLCVLLKTNKLKVFDWTKNRVLQPRAQHELLPTLLPVQQLVVINESHVFVQGKKQWSVLNLDNGQVLHAAINVVEEVNEVLEGGTGVCDVLALPSRFVMRRRQNTMDLLLCGKQYAIILTISEEEEQTDEMESKYCGIFDNDAPLWDEWNAPMINLTSRLCVKVEKKFAYDTAPRAAYYHHPFLLLDQADQTTVYNMGSLQLVQAIPLKVPYGVCAAINVASATVGGWNANFRDDRPATLFTVSPPFVVQKHEMLPLSHQVAASIGNRRLEDAVALCKLCPDESPLSNDNQRDLYADYGFMLFRSRNRQQAMNFFFESDIDVMEVLLLFPRNLLPRTASALRNSKSENGVLEGDELVESLLALIGYLRRKRNTYLRNEDNVSAIECVSYSGESALEVVDTMLVKCLVLMTEKDGYREQAKRSLLEVVTGQNWCEIGEAEVFLRAHRRFKTLLAFYSARKLHRKALELLEDLERSAASTAVISEATTAGRNNNLSQNTNELQSSHEYMVLIAQYLRRLGNKHAELVFEFSRRVLSVNPELGLSIFTQRDVAESRQDIDHAAVLQHLKSCPISASNSNELHLEIEIGAEADVPSSTMPLISSQMLCIEYLTQIIYEGTCHLTPRLHDEVVFLLLALIHANTAHHNLTSRVESQRGITRLLRRKLLQFLEFPGAVYHPERMLSRTPIEMVDEHAALLSKLGRHLEVLQLYAITLNDAALAEAYCNRCYESKTAGSSIYTTLLRIYLGPHKHTEESALSVVNSTHPHQISSSESQNEAVNAAINVLNKHAERIDVSTALELLPPNVLAAPLAAFFRCVLEHRVERFRNGQVMKQLSKMENFKVREQLTTKRKESVTVWASQCCQWCGKKLGVGTFVRLPNRKLLHYACQPIS
ncbi:hypothetical protein CCR75_003132 [Bremia lactucae]|uniref:CNH domain-containing protein n=1 Tax=Bremia lactucae TaxID=4779 RepID=A0A976FIA7_BRELC|nr:hypothetical protein CCR75_003132 [Bremia lactucae]